MLRDKALKGNYLRPRHDQNPALKLLPKYALDNANYFWNEFVNDRTAITSKIIARLERNRSYGEGRQDSEIYKKEILGDPSKEGPPILITDVDKGTGTMSNGREGWDNMNFEDIFSPAPKYINNIVGIMEAQDHDVVVEATDENSGSARAELKYSILVKEQLRDVMQYIQQTFKVQLESDNAPLPKSVEELDLYSNLGMFKLPYEIAQEKILSFTQHISDNPEIKKQLIIDAIQDGYIACDAYVDSVTGLVKYKRVDVTDLIIENSKERDFKDASFYGVPIYYTIVDFRNENPGMSETEVESLAKNFVGKYGNPTDFDFRMNENGTFTYDEFKIMAMKFVWKSTDIEYKTTRINQQGEEIETFEPYRTTKSGKVIPPKEYNKDNRKTTRTDQRCLYQTKWVVGTEHVWDYGKFLNTPFDYNFKDTPLPVRLYRLTNKPIVESLIPILDQIEFTFLKLQNDIIKAAPSGMAIEFGSLENISYGNRKLKPKDVLKIYTHTGKLLYRLAPMTAGQAGSQAVPFHEIKGGYGESVANAVSALSMFYEQLSIISGIDQYSSVNTTPGADAGKAVTEIAVAATGNTLKPIYSAYVRVKEQMSRVVALMAQAEIVAVDKIEESPYFKIIGGPLVAAVQAAENYPPVEWGFKIVARPTEQLKNEVMAAAQASLAGGKNGVPLLSYSEYLFIVEHLNSGGGIKYARLFLAHREGKAQQEAQEAKDRAIQMQGEQNLMLKKAENEKVQIEMEKELAVVAAKGELEYKLEMLKHQNKLEQIAVEASVKPKETNTIQQ